MLNSKITMAGSLLVAALAGCADLAPADQDDGEVAVDEAAQASTAVGTLASIAAPLIIASPRTLPAGVPTAVLDTTTVFNGTTLRGNLRTMLTSNTFPYARITGAFRTTRTPALLRSLLSPLVAPAEARFALAAQVYQCRANATGYSWAFVRPEAGLEPITTTAVDTKEVAFDHFLYPTAASPTALNQPAWRESRVDGGEQDVFVGARDASADNGAANIPLLRVVRLSTPQTLASSNSTSNLPANVSYNTPESGYHQVGYVLRLNTVGGIAPTTGCAVAADNGKVARVPYSADYYFLRTIWASYDFTPAP
jgi:Protein of unknown function (DUF3455)